MLTWDLLGESRSRVFLWRQSLQGKSCFLGASCWLLGLCCLLLGLFAHMRTCLLVRLIALLICRFAFMCTSCIMMSTISPNVDFVGHFAGMLAGFLLAIILADMQEELCLAGCDDTKPLTLCVNGATRFLPSSQRKSNEAQVVSPPSSFPVMLPKPSGLRTTSEPAQTRDPYQLLGKKETTKT